MRMWLNKEEESDKREKEVSEKKEPQTDILSYLARGDRAQTSCLVLFL